MQEKEIKIDDLNINYKEIGSGDILIVLLHGWGIDSDQYVELAKLLGMKVEDEKQLSQSHSLVRAIPNYKIVVPDLPGFGKSDEPNENWNLDNYVEFTDKFIKSMVQVREFESIKNIISKTNIKNIINGGFSLNSKIEEKKQIILIGHSFGGRIAIKYVVKYPEKIEKLILTGAAGIKHRLNIKQKMILILAMTGKKVFFMLEKNNIPIKNLASKSREFLYKIFKEKDYKKASLRMKEIMKNILAEDLTPILEKIKMPTLLVWGKLDNSTPLADGKLMNQKIKNSELVVIDDTNHSLPYQKPKEFVKVIKKFMKKYDFNK